MEKKIKGSEREYTVKELKYKDLTSLADISKEEAAKKLMLLSTDLTEEEYEELSLKDGVALQKAVNELNGLTEDFQTPLNA